MATEFELSGERYSIGKMPAMTQFHVSRRIAPVLPAVVSSYAQMASLGKSLAEALPEMVADMQPVFDCLAAMKDADVEYVMNACLAAVQRYQAPHGWAKAWNAETMRPMFQDMELPVLLQLVAKALMVNLGAFMPGLLTSQQGGPEVKQAG